MKRHTDRVPTRQTKSLGIINVVMLLAAAWLPWTPARAATPTEHAAKPSQTWRCTSASGQISYSQQACPANGELVTLKDARTHGQQRQAIDNQERDAKLARRMQRERRHEERLAEKERAVSLSGKPHVIQSTPNSHAPVPFSDMSKPIRLKQKKKAAASSAQPSSGGQTTAM